MSGLTFDENLHEYRLDGVRVPSVTQVIAPLNDFSKIDPDILERARQFGIAAHKLTELWDKNMLDEESLDIALIPYLQAWQKFLKETGFVSEYIELPVYSEKYRYAGRLDRVGLLRKGDRQVRAILDIKTGAIIGPEVGVQLMAYQQAYNAQHEIKAIYRASVQLTQKGKYRLDWWEEDKMDWGTFLALLQIKNWRIEHGKDN